MYWLPMLITGAVAGYALGETVWLRRRVKALEDKNRTRLYR